MTMKTKRIASLLLSAALLLSLAVPAFAENPTTEETAEPETAMQLLPKTMLWRLLQSPPPKKSTPMSPSVTA